MQLTGNVQGLIDLVGGGSDVEVTPIVQSGTKIATIEVDGVSYDLYAPDAGSDIQVTPILESGTKIASIEVDGEGVDLYAPTPEEPTSVEVTQVLTSGTKIATIEVDGESTDLYAPEGGGMVDYSTTEKKIGSWIDGSDLYQKVIPITLTGNSTAIDISSLNVNKIISFKGIMQTNNQQYLVTLPYYENGNWYCVVTADLPNYITFSSSNNIVSNYSTGYLIIEYVKNVT